MATVWTDPPIEMRQASPQGEFAVACLTERELDSSESAHILRRNTRESALSLVADVIEEGGQARAYGADGSAL